MKNGIRSAHYSHTSFFQFKGARVPHRLCLKGWHPLQKGVTGATMVPHLETHQLETHPSPPCLGRELLLLRIDIIPTEDEFVPPS